MNKEILTQFKTQLSKIGLDAQNVQKRDPARASLSIQIHLILFSSFSTFEAFVRKPKPEKNLQRAITRDQKLILLIKLV